MGILSMRHPTLEWSCALYPEPLWAITTEVQIHQVQQIPPSVKAGQQADVIFFQSLPSVFYLNLLLSC